jgi:hypothetical protein
MKNACPKLAVVALMMFGAGCADAPGVELSNTGLSNTTQAAIGPATVTTNLAAYNFATPVTVTYAGLDGSSSDWIAIAPQGSPLTTTTRWGFTGGGATGSKTFEGPATGGTYVARAFDASSALLGESDPFTVADPTQTMATVAATQAAYTMTDPITIAWTGLPGNPQDWVAIAPQGFPDNNQAEWRFTMGAPSGSVTFLGGFQLTGFPPGNYVARAYLNGTFVKVAESAVFAIGATNVPSITTTAPSYTTVDPITVVWSNLPGNAKDWVALAPSGSPVTTVSTWVYTGGAVNGNTLFNVAGTLPAGTYVARAFVNDSNTLIAESPAFPVNNATATAVSTDRAMYSVGQPITISWTNLTAITTDWVGYAPAGSPDTTVTRWAYTGAAVNGSHLFEGALAPGTYVARAFVNDTYTKVAQSAPFVVQ